MNDVDFDSVAKRAFTEKEQDKFFSSQKDMQKKQFYKLWTAKESYINFLGTGIRDLDREIPDECSIDTIDLNQGNGITAMDKLLIFN